MTLPNEPSQNQDSKTWPPQKHDRAYRRFFSYPEMVEDLVRGFVTEPWVENLDFDHMEQLSDVFVGEKFDRRDADTIWKIRWKAPQDDQPPVYVIFIFEFLSSVDPWAAVRLLAYVALFYQRLIDNKVIQPGDPLPSVVPIVLYNGDRPWDAEEELSKLIAALPGLERYRPSFRYLALDEKRFPLARLEAMPNRAAALFQLEQSRGPEEIWRGLERIKEILPDPDDRLYGVYTHWLTEIFLASAAPPELVAKIRTSEDFTMLVENILEWQANARREGERDGLRKGEKVGLRKGEKVGLRKGVRLGELAILRRLLESKFGELSADTVDRLERADIDQLLEWSVRVLKASTLGEVFADGQ